MTDRDSLQKEISRTARTVSTVAESYRRSYAKRRSTLFDVILNRSDIRIAGEVAEAMEHLMRKVAGNVDDLEEEEQWLCLEEEQEERDLKEYEQLGEEVSKVHKQETIQEQLLNLIDEKIFKDEEEVEEEENILHDLNEDISQEPMQTQRDERLIELQRDLELSVDFHQELQPGEEQVPEPQHAHEQESIREEVQVID